MVDHQDFHGAHGGPHLEDLPDTCRECGGKCSPAEQRICLSELDGAF